MQDCTRASEYLALARELPGYGDVVFPHCSCDSRKDGHVVVSVGSAGVTLHACSEDGTLESQVVQLQWDCIRQWEADDEAMAFCLRYNRPDKTPKWLKIFTPYVSTYLLIYTFRIITLYEVDSSYFVICLWWTWVAWKSWENYFLNCSTSQFRHATYVSLLQFCFKKKMQTFAITLF